MFVSRKKFNALVQANNELLKTLQQVKDRTILIGIERKGRTNVFTFIRGDKVHKIETMGMIADDFGQWRKDLL